MHRSQHPHRTQEDRRDREREPIGGAHATQQRPLVNGRQTRAQGLTSTEQVSYESPVDDAHTGSVLGIRVAEPAAGGYRNPCSVEVVGTDGPQAGSRIDTATVWTPGLASLVATSSRNNCRASPLNAPRKYKSTATS